jgi:hypothetical protein
MTDENKINFQVRAFFFFNSVRLAAQFEPSNPELVVDCSSNGATTDAPPPPSSILRVPPHLQSLGRFAREVDCPVVHLINILLVI